MTNDPADAPCPDAGPTKPQAYVRDILEAVGSELLGLGEASSTLQALLRPTQLPDRQGLQALDLLTQRLFALSDFLTALTPSIREGYQADPEAALAAVCLSDMGRRLAAGSYSMCHEETSPGAGADAEAGVIELF